MKVVQFKAAPKPAPGKPMVDVFYTGFAQAVTETASAVVCADVQIPWPKFDALGTADIGSRQLGSVNFPKTDYAVQVTEIVAPAWFHSEATASGE